MDAALIEKVKNWQAHVDSLTSSENSAFQVQRAEISKLQGRKAEKEGEITRLKQELSNLQVQQSAIISDTASQDIKNANLKALHPQILAAKSALSTAEGALSSIQTQLNTENDKLLALQKQVRLESVFTPAEMEVLSRFIQQGAYTEENITKQDNMSYEEAQAQALELYNKAQNLLKTISTPRYEYSVETASFVFQKEFAHLTSQLRSGCLIDIRLSEEDIASLLLLEMAVDYDGRSLSLTFGNRYKLSDPSALFNDLVGGSVAKTASTVEYLRTTFDFKQQKDDLDHLAELKDESINLTHNMVVNADNQVMVIDASGISGRRAVIGENGLPTGDYEPEVLKITNNTIAFSTDDFETTETVLGKNLLPDGVTTPDGKNYMYGLNAKLLMGDLIIGENLKVSGEIEGRLINAKGLTVNNGVTDTLRVDENGDVSLNVKSLSITGNQVATKGDVTSGLNGMQIGSRNYIKDSVSRTLTANSTSNWYYHNLYTGLENTQYTFSVGKISVISGSATKVSVLIYDINNAKLIQTMYLNVSNSKQQISFTPPPSSAALSLLIYAGVAGSTAGNSLKYEHMKLEKGSKATDWSPAPEDRSYLVNTLSPTQADGLWLGSDGKLNITATQIKAGKLQSKDGSSYFDLENGKIMGKNAEMTGSFISNSTYNGASYTTKIESAYGTDGMGITYLKNNERQGGLFLNAAKGLTLSSINNVGVRRLTGNDWAELSLYKYNNDMMAYLSVYTYSPYLLMNLGVRTDLGAYYQHGIYAYKLYHAKNLQCGEAMVPNGSLSGSIYTGETTVSFSPAFSKAPRVIVTPRTGAPYTVQAAVGGPPTANSVKIIVQRNTKTADGYTAVQWIAIEPD